MDAKKELSPIFIFSLPRSGSTLLQRMITGHHMVASSSEPWLLLPHMYATKPNGVLAEYSHINHHRGFMDFFTSAHGGIDSYYRALNSFITELYSTQISHGETFFLDKTPRYHLIINEIVRTFPEGKFIFLFRNPAEIVSSVVSTYFDNRLYGLYTHSVDFNYGFQNLIDGYVKFRERSHLVCYDDLVLNPESTIQGICKYLDLEYSPHLIDGFGKVNFQGSLGDPGYQSKRDISSLGLSKWLTTLYNPVRVETYLSIIKKIPQDSPFFSKTSKKDLMKLVRSRKWKGLNKVFLDIFDILYSHMFIRLKPQIFFGKKISKWSRDINFN